MKKAVAALALVMLAIASTASAGLAQWPTTCVELNDIVENHLGNHQNVGIYQRVFGEQAEQGCQNDHRGDVRETFHWAGIDREVEVVVEREVTREVSVGTMFTRVQVGPGGQRIDVNENTRYRGSGTQQLTLVFPDAGPWHVVLGSQVALTKLDGGDACCNRFAGYGGGSAVDSWLSGLAWRFQLFNVYGGFQVLNHKEVTITLDPKAPGPAGSYPWEFTVTRTGRYDFT